MEDEEYSYRAYVTDTLRLQGENQYPTARWMEIIEPKLADDRTGDEIALEVIRGAGLTLV